MNHLLILIAVITGSAAFIHFFLMANFIDAKNLPYRIGALIRLSATCSFVLVFEAFFVLVFEAFFGDEVGLLWASSTLNFLLISLALVLWFDGLKMSKCLKEKHEREL